MHIENRIYIYSTTNGYRTNKSWTIPYVDDNGVKREEYKTEESLFDTWEDLVEYLGLNPLALEPKTS